MKIELKELWEEADIGGTIEEYIETIVTKRVDSQMARLIDKRISGLYGEIASTKAFADCADSKINTHLIGHNKINQGENDG